MRTDPGDPFAPERIVVPHPTIGRWLSLELARGLGIAANIRYEQPADFAWSIMRAVVPELSREQPYEPARLRWRIHDLLPGRSGETGEGAAGRGPAGGVPGESGSGAGIRAWQGAVRDYLRDGDPRKRLDLADRLARMYDRCLNYRPDWIREWEKGEAPHWQARLWQCLVGMDDPGRTDHWVRALDRFVDEFRRTYRDAGGGSLARDMPGARSTAPPLHDRSPDGFPDPAVPPAPAGDSARPPGWPRRASFFAVSALSPSYLELLCEAGRGIDIHLFLLNPCEEYWGDIRSRREIDFRSGDADPVAGYFTEGNELLAAWGRAGRDMFDALVEVAGAQWEEHFVPPAGGSRLAAVQRDILDLRLAAEAAGSDALPPVVRDAGMPDESRSSPRAMPEAEAPHETRPPLPAMPDAEAPDEARPSPPSMPEAGTPDKTVTRPPAADDSIQIHVCHSPVREAEVLHDRLLALFDAHRDLEPADVLVLTPDLETCGPAVEAVFAAAGRIPCNVARARTVESRTLRAFLDLLSLPGSRYGAEAVLAPLAAPAVRVRFGIEEADLPAVRAAVREAGIRWGVDDAHRAREDLPETLEHTWRQGLRRLLLGYAMTGAHAPVAGLVPCAPGAAGFDAMEMDGELLGRFVSYCEEVFDLRDSLAGERRPAQWGKVLRDAAGVFLADGSGPVRGAGPAGDRVPGVDLDAEVRAVRALVRDFEREAARAEATVPFEVVLDALRERAQETGRGAARLADGVTVASLGFGRIFPAEVVCVTGMNDGVFPRSPAAASFDLVAGGAVRRGDRDIRLEDRFAFMEAFLAARRCFLATCTGRGLRDDAPIPPSVLVDELKDYLARRFPGAVFETLHPLQPFSPRYFVASAAQGPHAAAGTVPAATRSGGSPYSYSRAMCEAAKAMLAGRAGDASAGRFQGAALPEPDASRRRVDLGDLVAFFANPARFFLRERLGARLELDDLALEDEEPFELDGLERYHLRSDIWSQMRAGVEPERAAVLLHGSGRLPQSGLGRIVHERARAEVEPLEERLAPYRTAIDAPAHTIDFELAEFRVTGTVEHVESVRADAPRPDAPRPAPRPIAPRPGAPRPGASEPGEAAPDENAAHRMVWWRIGGLRARDRIDIWLRQLAWAAAGHGPMEAVVVWLERGTWKSASFSPPDDARVQLGHWLRAWWRGQVAPLAFFPETSFEFARTIARAGDAGDSVLAAARVKAHGVWIGGRFRRGERLDPCFDLVHDTNNPLTDEFEDLARTLLVPLAQAQP